jgi:type III pantothenate kinase
MLLALDMGNTQILAGVFQGGSLLCTARAHTASWRTSDEWAVLLRDILSLNGITPDKLTGSILSSVAWPATDALCGGVRMILGKPPLLVGSGIRTGLEVSIDHPAQLGSDAVCNAVGALALASGDLIIFDMGTATSMSVIDSARRFIGGAIMPGLVTSMESLSEKTSQLPKISIAAPPRVVGANTVDCMRSGAVFGWASMLDGMAARVEDETGRPHTVFATGGMCERIVPHMRREVRCEPHLLLGGLRLIYEQNKSV